MNVPSSGGVYKDDAAAATCEKVNTAAIGPAKKVCYLDERLIKMSW